MPPSVQHETPGASRGHLLEPTTMRRLSRCNLEAPSAHSTTALANVVDALYDQLPLTLAVLLAISALRDEGDLWLD